MSKLTLDSVEWGEFRIKDVFEVANSKPYHKDKLMLCNNGIEYVTRTSQNNGVEDIVSLESNYILNEANSISLGAENADFFYHENKYLTGNKMYCIKNQYINKFNGLFLVNIFRNSIKGAGFGYGKGLTGTRFKTRYILLPIDDNGKPNWQFMEDYIKQEMKVQSSKVASYYENKLMKLGFELLDYDVKWKEFFFTDIFKEIKRGKRLTKSNQIDGNIPYVSSTGINNGVDNFIGNDEKVRKYANNLSLANSGSVGSCFYHKYEYIASDHITALTSDYANEYVYKFMSTIISRLEEKYSFNREINDKRISREKLFLPIDKNDEPHWKYMSNFIKKLEKENIEKTLNHIYIYIIAKRLENKYLLKNTLWKEFFIEDICEIKSGKDIYERDRIEGQTPYVTATANNNGIGYFISNTNATLQEKCISVNRNGSVGYSFYHSYPALFGNDTRKLIPKYEDAHVAKFISFMISSQKEKYGYGYKMGTARLKRQKILLPINEDESINYEFMKKYIIIQEIISIYSILDYYKQN
ncbi:restriction endonuclease subunit S [Gemella morbillorum]|uniref:restriction endonuclease subunit S n=1 Tax=Gemella morbillorum TaxID=29391 RepID=UPI0023EFB6F4|nr:restriction endonuclease subunit S [Gemella morbillorum]